MIETIVALIMGYGMQGYYCTNNGEKLGYAHVYDMGVEIVRIVVVPDGRTVSEFPKALRATDPSFKLDPGVKCALLVPINIREGGK